MRKILLIFILFIAIILWFFLRKTNKDEEGQKQQAIVESRHSTAFNQSIDSLMNSYYQLTESLVNWDSIQSINIAEHIKLKLKNFNLSELKKDSSGIKETAESLTNDASSNLDSILINKNITGQRRALNSFSQNIYDFLRTVKYDRKKLYLQQCPMAFNEDEPGIWLSRTDSIRNPYLGLHHPRYGRGMINCGETKDTLNFIKVK